MRWEDRPDIHVIHDTLIAIQLIQDRFIRLEAISGTSVLPITWRHGISKLFFTHQHRAHLLSQQATSANRANLRSTASKTMYGLSQLSGRLAPRIPRHQAITFSSFIKLSDIGMSSEMSLLWGLVPKANHNVISCVWTSHAHEMRICICIYVHVVLGFQNKRKSST